VPRATALESQEVQSILGQGVLSRTGEKMGQIVDVIFDRQGQPRAAVIDFGGFLGVGSRKIAINWRAVHFVAGSKTVRVVLDLTREDVLGAPEYKPGEQVIVLEPTHAHPVPTDSPEK
jgi:sporulation protein YlmC with PRC-barrel domain